MPCPDSQSVNDFVTVLGSTPTVFSRKNLFCCQAGGAIVGVSVGQRSAYFHPGRIALENV